MSRMRVKEAAQCVGRLLRSFLREKMTRIQRYTFDVTRPRAPQRQRPSRTSIPGLERAVSAPQRKEWADDATTLLAIRRVVFAIERRRRTILLANRVSVFRISQTVGVRRAHVRGEHGRARTPFGERVIDDGV